MFDGTDISASGSGVGILNTVFQGSVHTDWAQTLTARLGYASNNLLFYGKIGGAFVHNSATLTATFADGTVASVSSSNTNSGWTAGLGVEFGMTTNWTVKAEWDWLRPDSSNFGGFVGDGFNTHPDIDMFTLGLNYKILPDLSFR